MQYFVTGGTRIYQAFPDSGTVETGWHGLFAGEESHLSKSWMSCAVAGRQMTNRWWSVAGDITEPDLGMSRADRHMLKGRIDHFFIWQRSIDWTRRNRFSNR